MVNKQTRITDSLIQLCADNIKLGMSYAACSKAIGITYQTWNRWVNLGQAGKVPYAKWYIAIQAAEADLMKECLESVKLSMKMGDVKSAMFLLQTRFSSEGYGKSSNVNMLSENKNLNLNVNAGPHTWESKEQMRAEICSFFDKLNKGSSPE